MALFADLELAQRLERTEATSNAGFVEARARLHPESGAAWIEEAGAYAMFDTATSPITQTFGLGLFSGPNPANFNRIERFFLDRGAPVCHEVSPLAGVGLYAALQQRGYQPIELTSVLYQPLQNEPSADTPAHIQIRQAHSEESDLWTSTSAAGWGHVPELKDFLLDIGRVMIENRGVIAFFAEIDGVPAGTAALFLANGVALLAGAATVPEARRQGVQLALLNARLQHAAEQGCDLAMMGASPGSGSQRNAERHGFRIAYTRLKWQLAIESNICACPIAGRF